MDSATLTDGHGRKTDFRNVILIMTTNAGSHSSGGIGFGENRQSDKREGAIKKQFRPEFRNRLDDTVYFHALPKKIIRKIVSKFIRELEDQLAERKVHIKLNDDAIDWLAVRGFSEELGARPMNRLIQKEIKDKLADEILFGKLSKGGEAEVFLGKNDSLEMRFTDS